MRASPPLALLAGPMAALCFALAPSAHATTVLELPDGKRSTLQAALALAQQATDGVVIVLPDGAWDYGSSGVEVDRLENVVIMGQGADRTRLYRSVCHGGAILRVNESENLRITGIKFDGCDTSNTEVSAVGVHLWDAKHFRIDHCAFREHSWAAVRIHGEKSNPRGVVDHCQFEKIFQGKHEGYGVGVTNNDVKLGEPFGSPKATFIEDCTFSGTRHAATANGAGRYVFRYNTITNNKNSHAVDAHGAEGASQTGTEWVEIYRNRIHNPSYTMAAVRIRGGKGLVWGNEVDGYQIGVSLWEETSAKTGLVRLWNNDFGGADAVGDLRGSPSWATGKPASYTPYTYPHPLVTDLEAVAGHDQKVTVSEDGLARAYVDGSASRVDAGSIVGYRWYDGDELVSSCARDVLELSEGRHALVLEAERSDGVREFDTAVIDAKPRAPLVSNDGWRSRWFVPVVAQGVVDLDVTPAQASMNGYVGLSGRRIVDAHADLGVRVRFNQDGLIDVRNGDEGWDAASPVTYAAGQSVHLTIAVDLATRRFSVVADGVTLAEDYSFDANVKTIGQIALWSNIGSLAVSNVTVSGALAVPDAGCLEGPADADEGPDDTPSGGPDDGSTEADAEEPGGDDMSALGPEGLDDDPDDSLANGETDEGAGCAVARAGRDCSSRARGEALAGLATALVVAARRRQRTSAMRNSASVRA